MDKSTVAALMHKQDWTISDKRVTRRNGAKFGTNPFGANISDSSSVSLRFGFAVSLEVIGPSYACWHSISKVFSLYLCSFCIIVALNLFCICIAFCIVFVWDFHLQSLNSRWPRWLLLFALYLCHISSVFHLYFYWSCLFYILHCICIVYLSELCICSLYCRRWSLLRGLEEGWLTASKSPPQPPGGFQILHWICKHTEFIRIGVDHRAPGKMKKCESQQLTTKCTRYN